MLLLPLLKHSKTSEQMSAYGSIPTEPEGGPARSRVSPVGQFFPTWFLNYLGGGYIDEEHRDILRQRKPEIISSDHIVIHHESIRQMAYLAFWFMVTMAGIFTTAFVPPVLIEHSHLRKMFGYNNICVNWDYSPSRELTAMVYPLFELLFMLYIVMDFVHLRLCCKPGGVEGTTNALYRYARVLFPIKLVLVVWFRLIFVYTVYPVNQNRGMIEEDGALEQVCAYYGITNSSKFGYQGENCVPSARGVVGHTLAFFGLQGGLFLVAFENVLFYLSTNVHFPYIRQPWTSIICWVYLALFFCNSVFQAIFAGSIFWTDKPILDVGIDNPNPAHVMLIFISDRLWLVLVGIMPLFFSQWGRKTQAPVMVSFKLYSPAWEDEGSVMA